MTVRLMTAGDLGRVRELDAIAFAYLRPDAKPVLRSADNIKSLFDQAPAQQRVAEHGGDIVGYAFFHDWGDLTWCGPIGVAPKSQGSGIGKALLGPWLRSADRPKLLETRPENGAVLSFYLGLGMRPLGLRGTFTGPAPDGIFAAPAKDSPADFAHRLRAAKDSWAFGDRPEPYAVGVGTTIWTWQPRLASLDAMLAAIASRSGTQTLDLPVDLSDLALVQALLQRGYRLQRPMQRFATGPDVGVQHARLMG